MYRTTKGLMWNHTQNRIEQELQLGFVSSILNDRGHFPIQHYVQVLIVLLSVFHQQDNEHLHIVLDGEVSSVTEHVEDAGAPIQGVQDKAC